MFVSFWQSIGKFMADYGLKFIGSALILVVGWKLIGWFLKMVNRNSKFSQVDTGAKSFLTTCVSIVLKVLLVLTVAAKLGVPMTNVVAVVGSCGLAIGLALQGSLSNFAGGIMILLFHPFRVGDFIESSGKEGTVKQISLLSTVISTTDNKNIIIPNGSLINSIITNYSAEEKRRVDLKISVAYDADTERVKKVLLLLAEKHPLILDQPAPYARMTEHGSSALIFTLRVWCKSEHYWDVKADLLEQIKDAFEKLGINIPYNQMDVHVK
jgi:small conductance mechanosensitive channel